MTEEFSAGGIVFRKIPNVIPAKAGYSPLHGGIQKESGFRITRLSTCLPEAAQSGMTIEILVSQHSGHHGWVFPKGHVADTIPDETAEEAAIREVQEETGITGVIVHPLQPTDYWYVFQGEKRHKTVQYFLMKYESGNTKDHGWEMENVVWLPLSEVEKKLTYKSDKKVWEEAKEMISKQTLQ